MGGEIVAPALFLLLFTIQQAGGLLVLILAVMLLPIAIVVRIIGEVCGFFVGLPRRLG